MCCFMRHANLLALPLGLLLASCADEPVLPIDATVTCDGPQWRWKRDLGFTRWNDGGGEAAESGGLVLVVWPDRLESTLDEAVVHGVVLDAESGEPVRDLIPASGDSSDVWVRGVDDGFYVFVRHHPFVAVSFVAHDATSFDPVGSVRSETFAFDAVVTSAGVLAFGDSGVDVFDHHGRFVAHRDDGVLRDVACRAAAALRDGSVVASCRSDDERGDELVVALEADGTSPVVVRNHSRRFPWAPVLAADDAAVFVAEPGDGELSVLVFTPDGREQIASAPIPLAAFEKHPNAAIIGAGACSATCAGISLVAEGDGAMLTTFAVHEDGAEIERFLLRLDGATLDVESFGAHATADRQTLTAASPGVLSTVMEFAPHLPLDLWWPPQTVVVERTCVRHSDNAAADVAAPEADDASP